MERRPMQQGRGRILLPPPPVERMLEVKEQLDGVVRRFDLECWLRRDDVIVGRWVAPFAAGTEARPTLTSWGVWWRTRSYGAYRTHHADGSLRGYRVDALDRVRISAAGVHYRDLLLDAWVTPDRKVHLEDEHDVAAATVSGQLTFFEQRRVARTRLLFRRAWPRIEARVDAAIAAAIASVEGAGR
jgi:hypothetical protein